MIILDEQNVAHEVLAFGQWERCEHLNDVCLLCFDEEHATVALSSSHHIINTYYHIVAF